MNIANRADLWEKLCSPQAKALWAKSGDERAHLSLTQHLIDAACVAEWLWDNWVSEALKVTLARLWCLNESEVRTLYCFYAGTHDVGKATVTFQRQIEDRPDATWLLPPLEQAGLSLDWPRGEGSNVSFPHGTASGLLLRKWLAKQEISKFLRVVLSAVPDAHHGFTSDPVTLKQREDGIKDRETQFDAIAFQLLDGMAEITAITPVLERLQDSGEVPAAPALQLMTGLVVMADWIASNEDAFPYEPVLPQVERVSRAMEYIQLPAPWQPQDIPNDLPELFRKTFAWGTDITPRPVQQAAVEAAMDASGPTLMIIEAPTGEGKTEAGLAAAHVLGDKFGSQGVFLAAPTMATANGLFERATQWAQHSSRGGQVASMFLAHSKNQLSKPFQELRYSGIGIDQPGEDDTAGSEGTVVAIQWLSGRKTGVLSDFVVGTVDQVLMMALQVRHSMLRHVALAGKIVIIDEVHAYDAYMSQYLYRTLEWLARYGTSVILMSATLPPAQRLALARAYNSQIPRDNQVDEAVLDTPAYPLVSVVNAAGIQSFEVSPRPTDAEIRTNFLGDSLPELTSKLQELLDEGGIALVICNTVARAQDAYSALAAGFPGEVELHHAAFIASQRSEKEDLLREKLGPKSCRGQGRPQRLIVVATQVAEQSLDIDADVLITDIAPIDLIIQRIGRVHRHVRPREDRPTGLREPQLFIRGVNRDAEVPDFDGGARAIYGEKLLLATMAYFPSVFRRPDDVAPLVRKVYADNPEIPDAWTEAWQKACEDAAAKRDKAVGRAESYRFPSPANAPDLGCLFEKTYNNSVGIGVEERGLAQVRDADFTVELVAILNTEYGYAPLGADIEILAGQAPTFAQARVLAGNMVRLPARMTRGDTDFEEIISALEKQTPAEWKDSSLLKGQVALRFDEFGSARLGRFSLNYTSELGLIVTKAEAQNVD